MMLSAALQQLLSIATRGFCEPQGLKEAAADIPKELQDLLSVKNGFFAFEQALRVFPTQTVEESCGVIEWNSHGLWRYEYGHLADGHFFFAEDIFGGQFSIKDGSVRVFDPETGAEEQLASNLDEWAQKVLLQHDVLTGHKVSHDWQSSHDRLAHRARLVPKTPFVLGGNYGLANLAAIDAIAGMKVRGNLARQIHDLPDGTKIKFEITA